MFFTPYWNIIGYAVFAIALLGLRELGSAMAGKIEGLVQFPIPSKLRPISVHFPSIFRPNSRPFFLNEGGETAFQASNLLLSRIPQLFALPMGGKIETTA